MAHRLWLLRSRRLHRLGPAQTLLAQIHTRSLLDGASPGHEPDCDLQRAVRLTLPALVPQRAHGAGERADPAGTATTRETDGGSPAAPRSAVRSQNQDGQGQADTGLSDFVNVRLD